LERSIGFASAPCGRIFHSTKSNHA
jgi:hypothetical protein